MSMNHKKGSYNRWLIEYNLFLKYMYERILRRHYDTDKIPFEDFCKFIYSHSSGFYQLKNNLILYNLIFKN